MAAKIQDIFPARDEARQNKKEEPFRQIGNIEAYISTLY